MGRPQWPPGCAASRLRVRAAANVHWTFDQRSPPCERSPSRIRALGDRSQNGEQVRRTLCGCLALQEAATRKAGTLQKMPDGRTVGQIRDARLLSDRFSGGFASARYGDTGQAKTDQSQRPRLGDSADGTLGHGRKPQRAASHKELTEAVTEKRDRVEKSR